MTFDKQERLCSWPWLPLHWAWENLHHAMAILQGHVIYCSALHDLPLPRQEVEPRMLAETSGAEFRRSTASRRRGVMAHLQDKTQRARAVNGQRQGQTPLAACTPSC